MLPLKVSLANHKCDCACHEKQSYHKHKEECCVVCDYCKFRIKSEHCSIHQTCHEVYEKLGEEK